MCDICQEPFEQFWEEDLEEWHFKDAIRPGDNKVSWEGGGGMVRQGWRYPSGSCQYSTCWSDHPLCGVSNNSVSHSYPLPLSFPFPPSPPSLFPLPITTSLSPPLPHYHLPLSSPSPLPPHSLLPLPTTTSLFPPPSHYPYP